MTDKLQEITQEIAKRHGVLVGRDDPVLMMHTMNEFLIAENARTQQAMLEQFRQELEGFFQRWKSDAIEKSERILNASLSASKETSGKLLQDVSLTIQKQVHDGLLIAESKGVSMEKVLRVNQWITVLLVTAAGISLLNKVIDFFFL